MHWRWFRRRRKPIIVEAVAIAPGTATVQAVGEAVVVSVASRVQAPSQWLSRKLPSPLKWLAGFEWFPIFGFGIGMIQVDEYLIAAVCWTVSFAFLLAKIKMWQRPTWLKVSAGVATLMVLGLLFFWTDAKRSDKAWSTLVSRRAAAPPPSAGEIAEAVAKKLPPPRVQHSVVINESTKPTESLETRPAPSKVHSDLGAKAERPVRVADLVISFGELEVHGQVFREVNDNGAFRLPTLRIHNRGGADAPSPRIRLFFSEAVQAMAYGGAGWQVVSTAEKDYQSQFFMGGPHIPAISGGETWVGEEFLGKLTVSTATQVLGRLAVFYGADRPAIADFRLTMKRQ